LDYLTPEVEVLNQSGAKRPPMHGSDVKFEVFIEITRQCARGIAKPSFFFGGGGVFFSSKNSAVLIFLGFAALDLGASTLNLRPALRLDLEEGGGGGGGRPLLSTCAASA
jgi:hypothetical protein